MERLLTTKDMAAAIGASESSMRRWTDSEVIRTSRTVGGHRRIPLSEAIRFIRETRATVVRPDLLGLGVGPVPGLTTTAAADDDSQADRLFDALSDGDVAGCRAIVLGLYLGGRSLAAIFDGPLTRAMHRIGEAWHHGPAGILLEHRATDICVQIVSELRRLIAPAPTPVPAAAGEGLAAPVAMGGAPQGDPYTLPSMMAAAVLAAEGYREVNFGADTPIGLLADTADERGAALVWIAVSTEVDAGSPLRRDVDALAKRLRARGAHLVIGGRRAGDLSPPRAAANVHVLQTMAELVAFTRGLRPGTRTPSA